MKRRRNNDRSALMLMVNTVLFGAGAGLVVLSWIRALQIPGRDINELLASALRLEQPLLLITVALLLGGVFHSFTILYPLLLESWAEKQKALEDVDDFRDQAYRDPLTGLYNRRYFDPMLEAYFDEFNKLKMPCALLVLDIDHFKAINDTHGHAAGDKVLCELAERISGMVRENDVVARIGGEEFAILIAHMQDLPLVDLAERIRRAVAQLVVEFEGAIIKPTASIGAVLSSEQETATEMLSYADQYLYEAKNLGRNRVFTKYDIRENTVRLKPHANQSSQISQPETIQMADQMSA